MTNPKSFDRIPAPAGKHDATLLSTTKDNDLSSQKSGGNRLGRILFNGFVGAFLALIPVFLVMLGNLFTLPYSSIILFVIWAMLAGSYTYWRIKSERVQKSKNRTPHGWGAVLFESPNKLVVASFLGGCISVMFGGFRWTYFFGGYFLTFVLLLIGCGYIQRVRDIQKLVEKNKQTIEIWVANGSDEDERSRRRAYVQSGALSVGAAAAGVAEYEGAPQLVWPTAPRYSSYDENDSTTRLNPSTGLPMSGNSGIDIGGNTYGSSSDY